MGAREQQQPTFASTVRLSAQDRRNVSKIIETGAATNTSEAIRVALALAPSALDIAGGALWLRALRNAMSVLGMADRAGSNVLEQEWDPDVRPSASEEDDPRWAGIPRAHRTGVIGGKNPPFPPQLPDGRRHAGRGRYVVNRPETSPTDPAPDRVTQPNWWGGMSDESLRAVAAVGGPAAADAQRELANRGRR